MARGHPSALSCDERWVCIDSAHTGEGRQLHLVDISQVIGRAGARRNSEAAVRSNTYSSKCKT